MGPEGIILVNSPITTFQQSLTHSAMIMLLLVLLIITAEKLIRRTLKLLILIIWGKMSFDKLQMLISNGLWF